ncbi:MAG: hypothetical protein A3G33_04590 [Omnitrophica bacterium RIFCSPLOWO2_12_FULL_44_17]|uniref:Uncharacterized protein n=1 Tax=Candidatus Danuiimicrobium aquiferis TaxID=1801832 RepID=A0A1G1KQU9_9BACT|nr:MAG: hypothetical protein A3B72_10800 [Omnitrophica bacterium RIFCSPHIGHO2_02_FULL_45_28]OGW95212.1 MAG: hypothetical protein A3G33_04590 [Omnitrophica bacterium RIFCSPLOWO2_12_FULL_44_17]
MTITVRSITIIFFVFLIIGFALPRTSYSVVGTDDIDAETFYRFEKESDNFFQQEREVEYQEKLLDQLREIKGTQAVPQKKKGEMEGMAGQEPKTLTKEEQEKLEKEILQLQLELVPEKRKWRDRIHTQPYMGTTFDSNLYRTRKDPKSDIMIKTGTLLDVDFGTSKTQAEFQYKGMRITNIKETKQSRWDHNMNLELGRRVSAKTSVTGYYRLDFGSNQTSEIKSFMERLNQTMGTSLNQRLSQKTEVRIRGDYGRQDFLDKKTKSGSSTQSQFGPELAYYLSKKTAVFGKYNIGFSGGGANNSNRATAHDFRGGIRGKIARKTMALVDLGASIQNNRGSVGGTNQAFVAQVLLSNQLTGKTKVQAFVHRGFSQAVETAGKNFFITTNFGLRSSTRFTRKLLGQIQLTLRQNAFDDAGSLSKASQTDTIFSMLLRMQYDIRKWLLCGLQYDADFADSTDKMSEYVGHRLSFDVQGRF